MKLLTEEEKTEIMLRAEMIEHFEAIRMTLEFFNAQSIEEFVFFEVHSLNNEAIVLTDRGQLKVTKALRPNLRAIFTTKLL